MTHSPQSAVLIMPDELGPTPEGANIYDRNNCWQLYSALSQDLDRLDFIALWDGKAGAGPGGTQEMIRRIREFTGRAPVIIDPADL
ncbi:MAG: hypothetical protein HC826_02015 [Rhodospirillales bacterium]|nr:hypothetical protein [Rhodospirillales bacterium]